MNIGILPRIGLLLDELLAHSTPNPTLQSRSTDPGRPTNPLHQRDFKMRGTFGALVDRNHRLLVVLGPGLHDVRHKRLRIPVVERKPGALYLNQQRVASLENMIYIVQAEFVLARSSCRNRLGLVKTPEIAPA